MIERMKYDIMEYKSNKDSKARDNLKFIIDNLDPDMLLSFISKLPKPIVERFCMEANPMRQAEMSSLKIIVRKACGNDRIAGTDGNYRLFLEKDGVSENVHFRYRETIIVYIIYLIDKLTHDEVDSITIKERRKQFLELYGMVYGERAETRFDDLVKPFDKDGNPRQTQLKHCYSDIRHSVGNVCERLCEPSAPFVMKSANDHLAVLKENITVPDELMVL